MERRFIVLLVAAVGCATSTAHRLPLATNPLRAEATACELRCHARLPAPVCLATDEGSPCDAANQYVDRAAYAACLDSCPGATAVDGAACPEPPTPGVVCEQTFRANPGGIVGGVAAVVAIVVALVLVSAEASLFNAEQRGLGLGGGR